MSESENELMRGLAEEWSGLLTQTLESMTDQKCKAAWTAAPGPSAGDDIFWWEQRLSLADVPLIWVGAPAQTWNELGSRTLRAAGIETVETADARNTWLEILSQALSGLAQSIGGKLGCEVTCTKGDESAQAPSGGSWISVEVTYDDVTLPGILLGFSAQVMEKLEHAGDARLEGDTAAGADESSGADQNALAAFVPHASKTLSLLLDVELPVSVSFGRAELLLKDVLKLTTGSIVELNRGVSEPVEVIVNNCVVARGEVVVMDGNYGVRIHQIISAQERLRTLK
jgi:flagellar motor switch protein FliN/FliY